MVALVKIKRMGRRWRRGSKGQACLVWWWLGKRQARCCCCYCCCLDFQVLDWVSSSLASGVRHKGLHILRRTEQGNGRVGLDCCGLYGQTYLLYQRQCRERYRVARSFLEDRRQKRSGEEQKYKAY
jgi:hypothetical protein